MRVSDILKLIFCIVGALIIIKFITSALYIDTLVNWDEKIINKKTPLLYQIRE